MDASQDDENAFDKTNEAPPSNHKRKRYALIKAADNWDCKTITLYGKLAKRWSEERGILSDTSFVEHLLHLRQKYIKLKSCCKCEASADVESGDFERENVIVERDEEDLLSRVDDHDAKPPLSKTEASDHDPIVHVSPTNGHRLPTDPLYLLVTPPEKRRQYDTAFKAEVVLELESGAQRAEVMNKYRISKSMVCRWLQDKHRILEAATGEHKNFRMRKIY